jgi:hypothetical protein
MKAFGQTVAHLLGGTNKQQYDYTQGDCLSLRNLNSKENQRKMDKRLMASIKELNIPVPPAPLLEDAVGYVNLKQSQLLGMWWELGGDEVVISDGLYTGTGLYDGYLAYIRHEAVYQALKGVNLGSSDEPAEYHLVFDLRSRKAYLAPSVDATKLLEGQWDKGKPAKVLSMEDPETARMVAEALKDISCFPSMMELNEQLEEDDHRIALMEAWLDEQIIKAKPK